MSSFVPLNVEIESESEEEVDDSKEIQIEEALKLYQNALKLHSQGPDFYEQAKQAYNDLFRSEIFNYPESLSEAQRLGRYANDEEDSEDDLQELSASTLPLVALGNDSAPSSLPQVLYLAYKNHGQFLLDRLRNDLSKLEDEIKSGGQHQFVKYISHQALSGLELFVESLDRDETDLELWRQLSRIGSFLGSKRIARYCLEAVLDSDETDLEPWKEPLELNAVFATEQLKPILDSLDDQISRSQIPVLSMNSRLLMSSLKGQVDPCPYLSVAEPNPSVLTEAPRPTQHVIEVPLRTWASCGKAILFQLKQVTQGIVSPVAGSSYTFSFPPRDAAIVLMPSEKRPSRGYPSSDLLSPQRTNYQAHSDLASIDTVVSETAGNLGQPGAQDQSLRSETSGNVLEQAVESPTRDANPEEVDNALINEYPNQSKLEGNPQETVIQRGSVILPTRKRSPETAELPESAEAGRSRSKRIKARGSIDADSLKDGTAEDWLQWYEQQLQIYHRADDKVFDAVSRLHCRLGIDYDNSLEFLRVFVSSRANDATQCPTNRASVNLAALDLKATLDSWDTGRSKAFCNGFDPKNPAGGIVDGDSPSFTAFLENSTSDAQNSSGFPVLSGDQGLEDLAGEISKDWVSLDQLSFVWLHGMLRQCDQSTKSKLQRFETEPESSYGCSIWPDALKETAVQILVNQDDVIYSEVQTLVGSIEVPVRVHEMHPCPVQMISNKQDCMDLVQTIFEIHLDVYGRITNPSSEVDMATRLYQRDRLQRWSVFAREVMNLWSRPVYTDQSTGASHGFDLEDRLCIRFLWASVVCNSLLDPAARENTIMCYKDLIHILDVLGRLVISRKVVIELPNNAIMPEISIDAAEKEVARLTTMDFLMGVFNSQSDDPYSVIESLEPLLDLSVKHPGPFHHDAPLAILADCPETASPPGAPGLTGVPPSEADPKLLQALRFLEQGSLSLRLFLWQKLRDAYRSIGYPPQVLACDLRILAIIVNHLSSKAYRETSDESRRDKLLRWLHRIDDHLTRLLGTAISQPEAFECVDTDHVRTALKSMASLQTILHVFALWEDTIRVGKRQAPVPVSSTASKGLAKTTDKFRDMIVKTWTFQYLLHREAMAQFQEHFVAPDQVMIDFLKSMHQSLGLRCYCSLASKSFLRLMKTELERCRNIERWEDDMAQLVFDLYGVKISSNGTEMQDHGCLPEELDIATAYDIMDLVMIQVNRISVKDLLRSDLRFTVDKMQKVIKIPRLGGSVSRTFNNRLVNNYLRSPINPYNLYRSLDGIGGIPGVRSDGEGAEIANRGWYFLLGHIALTKFRSQKRIAAGSTDDLEIARTFLRHDLEFDTERWETWYRLAQVYDTLIDEDATWSAEKLENHMDDIANLQRKAILCYSMALSLAMRCAQPTFEDTSKIAELRAEFGTRIYASTREPFSMRAFGLEDHKRHYNSQVVGMYQEKPFRPLGLYPAWKLASSLLRGAAAQRPHDWVVPFNQGKALWKMHNCSHDVRGNAKPIGYRPVIDVLVRTIKACPAKRDARHPEKEPILEPHYRLVSVVHKLVRSRRLPPSEGCKILEATTYSRKAESVSDYEEWESYVLQVLKTLRSADKSNWHHRIVARAAHTIYENDPNDPRAMLGAKYEFNQQIFTKTMAIQVWKPDNERAGRHFVYTSRYVRFFTRLLYQLNDRAGLEALARRIRKKNGDFMDHAGVWEEVCRAYLKLLRHQPNVSVPDGYSEMLFQGKEVETFQNQATRLETWMHAQTTSLAALEILREAIELKKLNSNYFKSTHFEDLVRDIYAYIFDAIIPDLMAKDAAEENRVRMRVDNILSNPAPAVTDTFPADAENGPSEQQKSKARWLTPKEIVRKAEAIAAKPAPTVPSKTLKPLAPALSSSTNEGIRASAVVIDADKDPASSVPGSVHDSADDESELSDVDEEVVQSTLTDATGERPPPTPRFPNIMNAQHEAEDEDGDMDSVNGNEDIEGYKEDLAEEAVEMPETQPRDSGVPEGEW